MKDTCVGMTLEHLWPTRIGQRAHLMDFDGSSFGVMHGNKRVRNRRCVHYFMALDTICRVNYTLTKGQCEINVCEDRIAIESNSRIRNAFAESRASDRIPEGLKQRTGASSYRQMLSLPVRRASCCLRRYLMVSGSSTCGIRCVYPERKPYSNAADPTK